MERSIRRYLTSAVAVGVGITTIGIAMFVLTQMSLLARLIPSQLEAAKFLHSWLTPYHTSAIGIAGSAAAGGPLPASLQGVLGMRLTFAALPADWTGALIVGVGSALLCFGMLSRGEAHRLPVLLSPSSVVAVVVAPWSLMVIAASFLPWLRPEVTGGVRAESLLPLVDRYRQHRHLVWVLRGALASLLPLWLLDWPRYPPDTDRVPPRLIVPGPILLVLALLWLAHVDHVTLWFALVPQFLFWYGQLLLVLRPRGRDESWLLVASSWTGFLAWQWLFSAEVVRSPVVAVLAFAVLACHVPAVGLLVWQKRSSLRIAFTSAPASGTGAGSAQV